MVESTPVKNQNFERLFDYVSTDYIKWKIIFKALIVIGKQLHSRVKIGISNGKR